MIQLMYALRTSIVMNKRYEIKCIMQDFIPLFMNRPYLLSL